jgi:hypothetical protein
MMVKKVHFKKKLSPKRKAAIRKMLAARWKGKKAKKVAKKKTVRKGRKKVAKKKTVRKTTKRTKRKVKKSGCGCKAIRFP